MDAFRSPAVRLISVAAFLAAIGAPLALGAPSAGVNHVASCPDGMVPNPAGYGCVPTLPESHNWPGGSPVGPPTQEVVTRCGGNYYICIWPYPVP